MNKLSNVVASVLLVAGVSAWAQEKSTTPTAPVPGATGAGGAVPRVTIESVTAVWGVKITPDQYRAEVNKNLSRIDGAIRRSRLEAPQNLPAGRGTLAGYMRTNYFTGRDTPADNLVGRLEVSADFDAGTVTTIASDFHRFKSPCNCKWNGGWDGRGRVYGTLSGRGTIDRTAIASKLQGVLDDGGDRNVVVNANLAGQVYRNGGKTLVHGDVTGSYVVTKRNRRTTDRSGPVPFIDISSGDFFATTGNRRRPGDLSLGSLVTHTSKRPGVKETISRREYLSRVDHFALIGASVEAGHLEAPRSLPAGTGTLMGYVKTDYFASSEDDIAPATRNYITGRLAVNADFDDGTVTTFASNFREFVAGNPRDQLTSQYVFQSGLETDADHWNQSVWSGRGEVKNGWNGRGRIYGTLSGTGTITATEIASTLDGKLSDGRIGDITVDANLAGQVYRNGGKTLVHGDVTGTYTPATENSLRGKKRASGRQVVRIVDAGKKSPGPLTLGDGDDEGNGEFFAIQKDSFQRSGHTLYDRHPRTGRRIVVRRTGLLGRLETPPGLRDATIKPFQHLQQIDNFDFIDAAVDAGHLEVSDGSFLFRNARGTLTGYVKADNLFSDRRVIGNLTIDARFGGNRAVKITAGDFSQFGDGALSGTLKGSGKINRSGIKSTLDGTITLTEGDATSVTTVDGMMDGSVYRHIPADNAHNDNKLLVHGDLTGSFTTDGSAADIEGGAFYAIEN
ncbi:MAG: hypothetical protein GDA49_08890 [Rhodospirillales bacterium]|nr:hypothetical protein [Rhodospirillales bacterium]